MMGVDSKCSYLSREPLLLTGENLAVDEAASSFPGWMAIGVWASTSVADGAMILSVLFQV